MKKAIIGKKVGMTQIFDEAGKVVPVTVIEAGPCVVVQKKTADKEGYDSVQLGFDEVSEKKLTKPERGHLALSLIHISSSPRPIFSCRARARTCPDGAVWPATSSPASPNTGLRRTSWPATRPAPCASCLSLIHIFLPCSAATLFP